MNPERWRQVDQLFQAALERAPEERPAFINEACGGDDSLRREVEVLLAADGEAEGFSGDKLRFRLRLLRVADGATLWADTLDQQAADPFAIEDALSAKVTGALKLTLSSSELGEQIERPSPREVAARVEPREMG